MFDPDEELPRATYDVTCHTDGCENSGVTLRVQAMATDPHVLCGPCMVEIADVVLVEES